MSLRSREMDDWKQQLAEYTALIEEVAHSYRDDRGPYRFGRASIIASDIAQQYFCEKNVEMRYVHGEVETEAKLVGTEVHEALLQDAVVLEREELWQMIYSGEPVVALEMYLVARFDDTIVAGKADAIHFSDGVPLIIYEYKFGRSRRPYPSHHVQAKVYGALLANMGFDTTKLFHAIVLASPEVRHDESFKHMVMEAVAMNGPKEAEITMDMARIFVTKFDRDDADRELMWAVEFWKLQRGAIPTRNPNKCRSCVYQKECDRSLV